jgi:hypothetical protein
VGWFAHSFFRTLYPRCATHYDAQTQTGRLLGRASAHSGLSFHGESLTTPRPGAAIRASSHGPLGHDAAGCANIIRGNHSLEGAQSQVRELQRTGLVPVAELEPSSRRVSRGGPRRRSHYRAMHGRLSRSRTDDHAHTTAGLACAPPPLQVRTPPGRVMAVSRPQPWSLTGLATSIPSAWRAVTVAATSQHSRYTARPGRPGWPGRRRSRPVVGRRSASHRRRRPSGSRVP